MARRDLQTAMLINERAAEYIAREAGRSTLITPTRTELSSDRKWATIFVSVFPTDQGEHAVRFLTRHKDLFRDYLKKTMRLARLPYIRFSIDVGEINRQRLDEISNDIGHIPDVDPDEQDEA
jgi:ribosome-binding factor A